MTTKALALVQQHLKNIFSRPPGPPHLHCSTLVLEKDTSYGTDVAVINRPALRDAGHVSVDAAGGVCGGAGGDVVSGARLGFS